MPEAASRKATLFGENVPYEVRHSDEASQPRIDVDIRGVRVVVPEGSVTDPEELLKENAAWVLEKKAKYDQYRERVPDRKFEPGELFPYLGDQYEIVVERRSSSQVIEAEFRLAKHNVDQTSVRRALESLYRRKARERFENQASQFAEGMGVEYNKIEVRNQRTKWGSCSTSGTLGLNWRLMMAPPEIVEYVVIHELAHLREPNHSDSFWKLVAKHDPEYQKHARWLKENSTRLIFSDDDL
ncbi:SprT family zinc-dependent metalloprotease [Halorubrum ezzemoulense]|uniref:M48 family metallopeptidase n=1 Tax=Halorubrum ezzemoulense TaxID=337243 RepID=UPI00232C3399|nr:SprT family zinc-dependent metalloprotease [Halorubrum ezzemoulense]MDB9247919.1 SprT family zinc-dependent metalloprotease [Halorubrum ezzemoulense]MDB9258172.1 SprT family zinc-dependent metalloprotease [Halorubrum ezzemoulense]MDB9261466.1 SprT family zinc-dependent metalloprotease [Halorubrum ezzemoulense]MDB9264969.1 SprT family zinc-dependent metalloprotease [Halorubrum ezzemoulense]MDB9268533.1 SprT family zinc-dependent metalloprotease [Halorubrum ezzemoulense]